MHANYWMDNWMDKYKYILHPVAFCATQEHHVETVDVHQRLTQKSTSRGDPHAYKHDFLVLVAIWIRYDGRLSTITKYHTELCLQLV